MNSVLPLHVLCYKCNHDLPNDHDIDGHNKGGCASVSLLNWTCIRVLQHAHEFVDGTCGTPQQQSHATTQSILQLHIPTHWDMLAIIGFAGYTDVAETFV